MSDLVKRLRGGPHMSKADEVVQCLAADEIDRLNKWADGFTDAHLKERMTGDALLKEKSAELSAATAKIAELTKERDALQRFKDFVHRRLDTAGIEKNPNGPHSAEGCRIGDRLDIVIGRADKLSAIEAQPVVAAVRDLYDGTTDHPKRVLDVFVPSVPVGTKLIAKPVTKNGE